MAFIPCGDDGFGEKGRQQCREQASEEYAVAIGGGQDYDSADEGTLTTIGDETERDMGLDVSHSVQAVGDT